MVVKGKKGLVGIWSDGVIISLICARTFGAWSEFEMDLIICVSLWSLRADSRFSQNCLFFLVFPSGHCRFIIRATFDIWVCLLVWCTLPGIIEFIVAGLSILVFPLALCVLLSMTCTDVSDVCPPGFHDCIFCLDINLCQNNKLVRIRMLALTLLWYPQSKFVMVLYVRWVKFTTRNFLIYICFMRYILLLYI